jgi:hypothetical protein
MTPRAVAHTVRVPLMCKTGPSCDVR